MVQIERRADGSCWCRSSTERPGPVGADRAPGGFWEDLLLVWMGLGSADADGWRRRRFRRRARARLLLAASGPAAGSGGVTALHGHVAERAREGGPVAAPPGDRVAAPLEVPRVESAGGRHTGFYMLGL